VLKPKSAKVTALARAKAGCSGASGRLKSGAAVCPGGNGGLLDLVDRNCPNSQEPEHDSDAARDTAVAIPPAPDTPRTDTEQLGDVLLRETERAEHRAEFNRSRVA
jgi:hypothetical protein